jgi:hypothetical protein
VTAVVEASTVYSGILVIGAFSGLGFEDGIGDKERWCVV